MEEVHRALIGLIFLHGGVAGDIAQREGSDGAFVAVELLQLYDGVFPVEIVDDVVASG